MLRARCFRLSEPDGVLPHDRKLLGDAGPGVGDQILLRLPACGEDLEVLDAPALPTGLQCGRPPRIRRPIGSHVHRRRRALEDEQLVRRRGEVRHTLDRRCPGSDDADTLVRQVLQLLAGVVVVPAAGVEHVTAKRLDAGNPGQLRLLKVSVGHGYEPRPHRVAAVRGDDPAGLHCVPTNFVHLRLQARIAVQVVVLCDSLAVREDFRALGVLFGGDVAKFFEQRHIHVRLDVAGDARIAVPVPGAAHVGGLVDQPHTSDTELAQPRPGQQPTESSSNDRHVHLVGKWLAREMRVGPRIFGEPGESTRYLDILRDTVRPQAPAPLFGVLLPQRLHVDGQVFDFSHDLGPLSAASAPDYIIN